MNRPAILLACTFALAACQSSAPPVEDLPTGVLHIETGSAEVLVEVSIAETPESRQRGLMFVEEMGQDSGMAFVQEEAVQQPFWMKNTLIPLSIAFWDEAGRIQAILDMAPCRQETCPLYDPGVPWIGAVEVNQGFFADNGIEVGDTVMLER